MAKLSYFNELRDYLKLDTSIRDEFLLELNNHIEDKRRDLIEAGLSDDEASIEAFRSLGSSRLIARQIYEVYSQGSWRQALAASLPHVLIAALFVLHLLPTVAGLITVSLLAIATVIYGWYHGKPSWLFPWLGVLLIPAIITGIMLLYLPSYWTWFAALVYIPLAVYVLLLVVRQTLKRDWLFISLMLMPVPLVLGWILAFSLGSEYFSNEKVYEAGSWIALSFAVLALTAVIFIRARQRWFKTFILIIPEILIITVVVLNSNSAISFWGWLFLSVLALALICGPAVIESKIK